MNQALVTNLLSVTSTWSLDYILLPCLGKGEGFQFSFVSYKGSKN